MPTHILYLFPKYAAFASTEIDLVSDVQAPDDFVPERFALKAQNAGQELQFRVMELSTLFGHSAVIPYAKIEIETDGLDAERREKLHEAFSVRIRRDRGNPRYDTVIWLVND